MALNSFHVLNFINYSHSTGTLIIGHVVSTQDDFLVLILRVSNLGYCQCCSCSYILTSLIQNWVCMDFNYRRVSCLS